MLFSVNADLWYSQENIQQFTRSGVLLQSRRSGRSSVVGLGRSENIWYVTAKKEKLNVFCGISMWNSKLFILWVLHVRKLIVPQILNVRQLLNLTAFSMFCHSWRQRSHCITKYNRSCKHCQDIRIIKKSPQNIWRLHHYVCDLGYVHSPQFHLWKKFVKKPQFLHL